jgi:hypothetical protein
MRLSECIFGIRYATYCINGFLTVQANAEGVTVILTEHSNSERGYLPTMKAQLLDKIKGSGVSVIISASDADPLRVV